MKQSRGEFRAHKTWDLSTSGPSLTVSLRLEKLPEGPTERVGAPFSSQVLLSRRAHYQEGVVPIDLIDESEQQACTDIQVLHPRDPYQHIVVHLWPTYTW